jgi:hypothetical protein
MRCARLPPPVESMAHEASPVSRERTLVRLQSFDLEWQIAAHKLVEAEASRVEEFDILGGQADKMRGQSCIQ